MKTKLVLLAFASVMSGQLCLAQTNQPVEDFKPATSNQEGKQYPQVNSEGAVRERIVAPQAQSVQLDIGAVKYPLTKGADGAWIGDSKPQDEGFHYYQIVVDGAQVPDPNSLYYYGASRWGSGIEIPAKDQEFYALKNVPHGQLREILYFSKTAIQPAISLSTLRRIMTRIRPSAIRCSICNTAWAKTKPAGATKAMPT
jgi:enterochelin esterase family protein